MQHASAKSNAVQTVFATLGTMLSMVLFADVALAQDVVRTSNNHINCKSSRGLAVWFCSAVAAQQCGVVLPATAPQNGANNEI